MVQDLKTILNSRALKMQVKQTLANYNSARQRLVRHRCLQSLGYGCSMVLYRKPSEERLVRKDVQIEVVSRKLLKMNGDSGVSVSSLRR